MLTTNQVRQQWNDIHCRTAGSRVITFGRHGARILAHPETIPAWRAVEAVMAHHGYAIRQRDTGSYNCRRITGGSFPSLHSYPGVATDVNWSTNPFTSGRLITDMPAAMVAEIKALRTRSGARIFRWGGDFVTVKDAMHYEIVCRRADLRTGIANAPTVPTPEEGLLTMFVGLKRGMPADGNVSLLQRVLNRLGAEPRLTIDGRYGPATAREVARVTGRGGDEVEALESFRIVEAWIASSSGGSGGLTQAQADGRYARASHEHELRGTAR